jgi:hypothetical protein
MVHARFSTQQPAQRLAVGGKLPARPASARQPWSQYHQAVSMVSNLQRVVHRRGGAGRGRAPAGAAGVGLSRQRAGHAACVPEAGAAIPARLRVSDAAAAGAADRRERRRMAHRHCGGCAGITHIRLVASDIGICIAAALATCSRAQYLSFRCSTSYRQLRPSRAL